MSAALARLAVAPVSLPRAVPTDPIFTGIASLRAMEAALTAALKDLDEDDAEQLRFADEAAERSADARNALSTILPTTPAGFCALIRFHAEDVTLMEPETYGASALRDIATALNALARASP